ncbi:MAG: hypothetical protein GEU28_07475 [Dehalococcoidia bacterium]|nr:hypothetical protein [Dehalococcoidia bacterium]
MKQKISVTLDEDLLGEIDKVGRNRSAFIEKATRESLARMARMERSKREIAIMTEHADELAAMAEDTARYAADPFDL